MIEVKSPYIFSHVGMLPEIPLHPSWSQIMAYVPRNKFFSTEAERNKSMENRLQFLHFLDKASRRANFVVSDDFVKDFIERND